MCWVAVSVRCRLAARRKAQYMECGNSGSETGAGIVVVVVRLSVGPAWLLLLLGSLLL